MPKPKPIVRAVKALLTGSYAYGTPTKDSDIDLVVLMTEDTLRELIKHNDNELREDLDNYEPLGANLKFGKLNLIAVTEYGLFKVWEQGTQHLIDRRPVSRDEAVEYLSGLREDWYNNYNSGGIA